MAKGGYGVKAARLHGNVTKPNSKQLRGIAGDDVINIGQEQVYYNIFDKKITKWRK